MGHVFSIAAAVPDGPATAEKPGSFSFPRKSSDDSAATLRTEKKEAKPDHVEAASTSSGSSDDAGQLYDGDGNLRLMPSATRDPMDPLNMSMTRKVLGLSCLCMFGALAASAELILGSMLPVFALEYAGVDPKYLLPLTEAHLLPAGQDAIAFLAMLPNAPPIWHTYLLGSMPVLVMGLANLLFIPLAIAIGRRPVVLGTGLFAIAGAIWAGFSQSLPSHIGARCLQALGAGTVESLIPFIIQDTVYFHQRNTWISAVFACQGTVIIALGIAAPHMIIYLSWRYVYYITAAGAGFFLIGVFFFLPETRWYRTKDELNGIPRRDAHEVGDSPPTQIHTMKLQTGPEWKKRLQALKDSKQIHTMKLQTGPIEWKKGFQALKDSLTTFFYPHIFFITMLNSAMIATTFASSFIVSPQLLAPPYNWKFLNLGLCLVPVIIAAIAVATITGKFADVVANYFAKKRGRRLPENQLINLALPVLISIIGSLIFGFAGQYPDRLGWPVFLTGLGFMAFGFLGAGTVGAVYVLEAYPQLAGPALVNIASFRCIIAFALSFQVSEWIVNLGYLNSMVIYTSVTAFFALLVPVVYAFGPSWRKKWPGPDR